MHRKSDISSNVAAFYADVFSAELEAIKERRLARGERAVDLGLLDQPIDGALRPRCERGLTGLALSGGGIRSATFNLGLLQGLAKIQNEKGPDKTLLPLFDYLSTVSGGGYIGSWLAGWMKNDGSAHVEGNLKGKPRALICEKNESPEPRQIQHLRNYSNYLSPKLGLFSIDSWSLIATYLRNALANQLVIIPLIAALLILPRLVAELSDAFRLEQADWHLVGIPVIVMSALAIVSAVLGLSGRVADFHAGWLRWGIAPLLFIVAIVLFWLPPEAVSWSWWIHTKGWLKGSWVGSGLAYLPDVARRGAGWALAMVALNLASFLIYTDDPQSTAAKQRRPTAVGVWLLSALVSGFVGGTLLYLFVNDLVPRYWHLQPWHVMTWGPGLAMLLFVVALHLQLVMRGKYESDLNREWWACLVGWLLIYAFLWTFLASVSIFGPLLFGVAKGWTKTQSVVIVTWLLTTVGGILAGRSPKTGDPENPNWLDYVAKVIAPIAIIGLFVMVAVGLNALFAWWLGAAVPIEGWCKDGLGTQSAGAVSSGNVTVNVDVQHGTTASNSWCGIVSDYFSRFILPEWHHLFLALGTALAIFIIMGYLIDLNQFSMHNFYRNRLVRCYLRAIRKKGDSKPHNVHGLDPKDDFPLADLADPSYLGPYLLINTTLNITDPRQPASNTTDSRQLGWQERKAAPFVMAPKYCGSNLTGYRDTRQYAHEIGLGMAFAISGAAFTSNMGYHSSRALSFFLSLFNVRLGWWVGNPGRETYKQQGPRWGLRYLLAELFGLTNEQADYIYLSDGGHFDNLGIYELIRRRCKYIVCSDAGEDPQSGFDDLGMVIRKVRADLGVDIEINLDMVRRQQDQPYSRWHHAIGTIRYDLVDESSPVGMLVYIKASLVGDEPADVLEYKAHHADFPHETTLDQFFSESQFEAYRKLGEPIGREVFRYAQQAL